MSNCFVLSYSCTKNGLKTKNSKRKNRNFFVKNSAFLRTGRKSAKLNKKKLLLVSLNFNYFAVYLKILHKFFQKNSKIFKNVFFFPNLTTPLLFKAINSKNSLMYTLYNLYLYSLALSLEIRLKNEN